MFYAILCELEVLFKKKVGIKKAFAIDEGAPALHLSFRITQTHLDETRESGDNQRQHQNRKIQDSYIIHHEGDINALFQWLF